MTMENDPRHPNCQDLRFDNQGKCVGIYLFNLVNPNRRYRLRSVRMLDEYEANGRNIAYVSIRDKEGFEAVGKTAMLAYPFDKNDSFVNALYPGSAKNEHTIANKFSPPSMGPLAIYVKADGTNRFQYDSDIIGGFGLPAGHHVSFDVVFQERGEPDDGNGEEPPPPPPPPTGELDPTQVAIALRDYLNGVLGVG